MSFLPFLGDLFGIVGDWVKSKRRVAEAKTEARIAIEAKKATANIDWDQAAQENAGGSWKDELWTVWFIVVLTGALFDPTGYVAAQLAALSQLPQWFQYGVLASIAASFGIREIVKGVNQIRQPTKKD